MHLPECQETFLQRGGAKKTQQLLLKKENIDKRKQPGLVVEFTEVITEMKKTSISGNYKTAFKTYARTAHSTAVKDCE
jgi:hypothetical protein